MDTFRLTISTLVGISVGVLVMSVLFAITLGDLSIFTYLILGLIIGFFSGLAVNGLLNKIE